VKGAFMEGRYMKRKTFLKAAEPLIVLIIGECLPAIPGFSMDKDLSYKIGTAVFCIYQGFRNWIKNHKKRGV
jgi:hypothetical protein